MTTEELIEELKKHPGKKVVIWQGDLAGWEDLKSIEVERMACFGEYWDYPLGDPGNGPTAEEVVRL